MLTQTVHYGVFAQALMAASPHKQPLINKISHVFFLTYLLLVDFKSNAFSFPKPLIQGLLLAASVLGSNIKCRKITNRLRKTMIIQPTRSKILTRTGTIACTVYRPQPKVASLVSSFYSEIFQQTHFARSAALIGRAWFCGYRSQNFSWA